MIDDTESFIINMNENLFLLLFMWHCRRGTWIKYVAMQKK